uniref:Uncharacterized protein n=1 Tax=Phlebotomus papatasi TaxID=29031 RepID=A0A1B0DFV9_PHLPP
MDIFNGLILLILTTIPPSTGDVSHLAFNGVNNQYFNDISLLRNAIRGEPNVDYPIYSQPPATSFSCAGRHDGYYADTQARCQVFRVCANTDLTGQGFAFLCPNGTLFSQKHFVCDWHYNVDCSQSPAFYSKNEQLGKRIESHEHMMTMVRYMQNFVMTRPFAQNQPSASQSGSSSSVFRGNGGAAGGANFGANLFANAGGSSFGQGFRDSSSSATNFDASSNSQAHHKIYVSNLGELSTEPGSGFDLSKSNIINQNLDFQQSRNLIGLGGQVSGGTGKFSGSAVQSNPIYLPPRPENTYIPPVVPQITPTGSTGNTQVFPTFPSNLVTAPPRVSTVPTVPARPPQTTTVTTTRFPLPQPTTTPLLDIRFGDDDSAKTVMTPSKYFALPLSPVEIKERELKKLGLLGRKSETQDSAKEGSAFFPQRVQFPQRFTLPAVPLSTGFSHVTSHQTTPVVSTFHQPTLYQPPRATSLPSRFSSSPSQERATDIQIIRANGYYFNDPRERKQYYDAVARGLYNDHGNGYVYIKPQFSQLQEVPTQRVPTVVKHHELQHSGGGQAKFLGARDTEGGSIFRGYDSYAAPLNHVGQLPTDTIYHSAQSQPQNALSHF